MAATISKDGESAQPTICATVVLVCLHVQMSNAKYSHQEC